MKRRKQHIVVRLAPALAALSLVFAWWMLREQGVGDDTRAAYFASVRQAVEEVPLTIGPWVGTPVDLQEAATEILNPNIGRQWVFENVDTGQVIQVLIVHCQSTKDMLGHYPPQCYPNAGWAFDPATDRELTTVPFGGGEIPATRYTFTVFRNGSLVSLNVLNFLALPAQTGGLEPDMAGVNDASRSRVTASLGGANVQLLSSERLDTGPGSAVERFMGALEPVVRTIVEGVPDER